jgi:GNAT superfamily N-acetyltransferase
LFVAEIRSFKGDDLAQLTGLVNAHVSTATPGWTVAAGWIAARLDRDTDEAIVDPWVCERGTLVGIEKEQVVAACHLLRFADEDRVSDSYRGIGEIAWLFCQPSAHDCGGDLVQAAVRQLEEWGVREQWACGGGLGPEVYGIPDCWPHVRRLLEEAGFDSSGGREEVLYAGSLAALGDPGEPPIPDLVVRRETFDSGVAFVARQSETRVAEFRVELPDPTELPALADWADGWGAWVDEQHRRRGVGTWLVRTAAKWLQLAGRDRLIMPMGAEEEPEEGAFWASLGLIPLTRIHRGFKRT